MSDQIDAVQCEVPTTVPQPTADEVPSISASESTEEETPVSQPTPSVTEASTTTRGDVSAETASASSEPPHSEEQKEQRSRKRCEELPVAEICARYEPGSPVTFLSPETDFSGHLRESSSDLIRTEGGEPRENDSEAPVRCMKCKRCYLKVVNVMLRSKKCRLFWVVLPVIFAIITGFGSWFFRKCDETPMIMLLGTGIMGTVFSVIQLWTMVNFWRYNDGNRVPRCDACRQLWARMKFWCCRDENRVPRWNVCCQLWKKMTFCCPSIKLTGPDLWNFAVVSGIVTVVMYVAGFGVYCYKMGDMNFENINATKYCDFVFHRTYLYGNGIMLLPIGLVTMIFYTSGHGLYFDYSL